MKKLLLTCLAISLSQVANARIGHNVGTIKKGAKVVKVSCVAGQKTMHGEVTLEVADGPTGAPLKQVLKVDAGSCVKIYVNTAESIGCYGNAIVDISYETDNAGLTQIGEVSAARKQGACL